MEIVRDAQETIKGHETTLSRSNSRNSATLIFTFCLNFFVQLILNVLLSDQKGMRQLIRNSAI